MTRPAPLLLALAVALSAAVWAPPADAARPMDRYEKLIAAGRSDEVVELARKWLDRNLVDERREAVVALMHEAAYQVAVSEGTVAAVRAFREKYPAGAREDDAQSLEANLSLYAAADAGEERPLVAVAEKYPGTAAAREAMLRAEAIALKRAEADGSAAAFGRVMSDYPDGALFEDARSAYRGALWTEAEATDTVESWLLLRASDPEHPRADEALAREATLAFAATPEDADVEAWLALARRYSRADEGRAAMGKAVGSTQLRFFAGPDDDEPATVWTPDAVDTTIAADGRGPAVDTFRGLDVVLPGRLPRGVSLAVDLRSVNGEADFPWEEVLAVQAGAWGLTDLSGLGRMPPRDDGDGAEDDERLRWKVGPCLAAEAPSHLTARLTVRWETPDAPPWEATRDVPVEVSRPCGGPIPLAFAVDAEGGISARTGRGADGAQAAVDVAPRSGGLKWVCTAPVVVDERADWMTCNGWRLAPVGDAFVIRAPAATDAAVDPTPVVDPAAAGLPAAPEGTSWVLPSVPIATHFAAEPQCPLPVGPPEPPVVEVPEPPAEPPAEPTPESTPEPTDEPALAASPPPAPAWLPPDPPAGPLNRDVDGDGLVDTVLRLPPTDDKPGWLLVVSAAHPGTTWARSLEGLEPDAPTRLGHDGCTFVIEPPKPPEEPAPEGDGDADDEEPPETTVAP